MGPVTDTENLMPCCMTAISFGATSMIPNSVVIVRLPCWGTVNNYLLDNGYTNCDYLQFNWLPLIYCNKWVF